MSFARMELLVDVDNRILVKSVTQLVPVQASSRPKFIYADTLILACTFVDKDGNAYALNAGDTFDVGLDDDFEHNIDTGTTAAGYSGAVTSIQVSGLTQQSLIPDTGHIVLINSSDESDRVAYTDFDGTDTFTVSDTLSNTYLLGDDVQVQDDLMAYSDDTQVDIAGDWADIDRATGKISIRINCLTDSFLRKIAEADANGQILTWLQIRRVPTGESEYTTMVQDFCYSYDSVIGSLGGAGNTFIDYLTQTQGDARYLQVYASYSEIGAALVDADQINVLDNGTGNVVKSNMSRVTTYVLDGTGFSSLTNPDRVVGVASAGVVKELTIGEGSITGLLTLSKTGTTARTATFPDAAIVVSGSASALTSGRIPYATAGGLLTDSANLLFDGTTLTANVTVVNLDAPFVGINGATQSASEALGVTGSLVLSASAPSYTAGQLSYDSVTKTTLADTGYTGVRVNVGQETHIRFYNDTGLTITNGTPVNAAGVDATNGIIKGIVADAASPATSSVVIGLATADVLPGEVGVATRIGEVNGLNTLLLTAAGPIYLAPGGGLTNTRPQEPENIVIIGSVEIVDVSNGRVIVDVSPFSRKNASRSYSFTSQGIGSGTFYKGGFYDWSSTASTITNPATGPVVFGSPAVARAAHVGIVPSGPGTVVGGQMGLQVTGTLDSEEGPQVANYTAIITDDITTLTANVMAETVEKFSDTVLFSVYTVSGTPTSWSLGFNYGFSKYEDFSNQNATVTGIDVVWQGNATDTGFDVALLHHQAAGWTYAATGFTPGNGDIARRSVDQALSGNVANGVDGSWKRINLNQYVEGAGLEGIIFEVTTGSINTIQTMDLHAVAVSEELT